MMRYPADGLDPLVTNAADNKAMARARAQDTERLQLCEDVHIYYESLCVHSGWISPRLEGRFLQLSTIWQKRFGKVLRTHDPNVLTLLLFDTDTSREPRVHLEVDLSTADFQIGTGLLSRKAHRFELKARMAGRHHILHRFEFAVATRKELAEWAMLFHYHASSPRGSTAHRPRALRRTSSAGSLRQSISSGPSVPSTSSEDDAAAVRGVRFDLDQDPVDDGYRNSSVGEDEVVPLSMSIGTPNLMFFPSTISMVNHAPPPPPPPPPAPPARKHSSKQDKERRRRMRPAASMMRTPVPARPTSSPMLGPYGSSPLQPVQEYNNLPATPQQTCVQTSYTASPPHPSTQAQVHSNGSSSQAPSARPAASNRQVPNGNSHRGRMQALMMQSFENLRIAEDVVATSTERYGNSTFDFDEKQMLRSF